MSKLDNITMDEIKDKIMTILIANEGKIYNQYKLYSLVLDKFINTNSQYVPQEFKYNFFIIIRGLMEDYDNISVIKENDIYQVVYNAPKDFTHEIITYDPEWIDKTQLNIFIINNDLVTNYQDPETGNTIFHDILSNDNYENAKLLTNNYIIGNVVNNNNKTPIESIKNIEIATLIINDLNKRLYYNDKKIEEFEQLFVKNRYNNEIIFLQRYIIIALILMFIFVFTIFIFYIDNI